MIPVLSLVILLASSWTVGMANAGSEPFVLLFEGSNSVGGLTSDGDGVWAATSDGIGRVTESGLEIVVALPVYVYGSISRDADGAFYVPREGLRKVTPTLDEPVSGQFGGRLALASGFTSGGQLLALEVIGTTSRYVHLAEDRTRVAFPSMEVPCRNGLVVGPGGEFYASWRESVYQCDDTTGAATRVATLDYIAGGQIVTGVAWGDDGALYVTEYGSGSGRIHRIDMATGIQTTLASLSFLVHTPVFYGESLYVATERYDRTRAHYGMGSIDVGTTGFQGFHPSFDLAPSPDLAITRTWVEREPLAVVGDVSIFNEANEVRRGFVEITNVGGGDVTIDFLVNVATFGGRYALEAPVGTVTGMAAFYTGNAPKYSTWVPGLAAGASVVVEFPWNMTLRAGDSRALVIADSTGVVPELVPLANNVAAIDQTVRIDDVPLA